MRGGCGPPRASEVVAGRSTDHDRVAGDVSGWCPLEVVAGCSMDHGRVAGDVSGVVSARSAALARFASISALR